MNELQCRMWGLCILILAIPLSSFVSMFPHTSVEQSVAMVAGGFCLFFPEPILKIVAEIGGVCTLRRTRDYSYYVRSMNNLW